MNIPVNRYLLIASWIFTSTLSSAYELVTHGLVTNQAYNLSRLTQSPSLLVQLGFNGAQPPLSDVYFDFGPQTGNVVFARRAQLYEEALSDQSRGWMTHYEFSACNRRNDTYGSNGSVAVIQFERPETSVNTSTLVSTNRHCDQLSPARAGNTYECKIANLVFDSVLVSR